MFSGNTIKYILLIAICSICSGILLIHQTFADTLDLSGNVYPSDQYKQTILDNSTVTAFPTSAIVGHTITITIILKDYRGPLAGHTIVLNGVGLTSLTIVQNATTTDSNGQLSATITSPNPGSFDIFAVDTYYHQTFNVDILLTSNANISFLPSGSVVLQTTPTPTLTPTPTITSIPTISPTPIVVPLNTGTTEEPFWKQLFLGNMCMSMNPLTDIFYFIPFVLFPLLWKLAANRLEAKEASFLYMIIVLLHIGMLKILCLPVTLTYVITAGITLVCIRILHQPIKKLIQGSTTSSQTV